MMILEQEGPRRVFAQITEFMIHSYFCNRPMRDAKGKKSVAEESCMKMGQIVLAS